MASNTIRLSINAFFGDDQIDISFPGSWEVKECRMAGHGAPALSDEQMRAALRSPIGTPRLSEMAKGAKEVCILFDDLPKPTPADRIAPFVLEELHEAGVTDEHIRFVCAPGTHRYLVYPEFVAKLGRAIVERYPVYNHLQWENLTFVGKTSRGTPVQVNREFASCDLRLGIGSLFPHGLAGFGGGGKIVLPGICSIDTIEYHHSQVTRGAGMGRIDENQFRLDIEEAARLAGLHFKVDAVLNERRQVSALFAGDFVAEHRAATALARQRYRSETAKDVDVVVVNSYPDESQIVRSYWTIPLSLRQGGDAVVLTHSWEGQNLLQISSRFGTDYGGRMYRAGATYPLLEKADRVFVLAPQLAYYDRSILAPAEKLVWCKTWDEVRAHLEARHSAGTKVGVYPYAPLQMVAAE